MNCMQWKITYKVYETFDKLYKDKHIMPKLYKKTIKEEISNSSTNQFYLLISTKTTKLTHL